MPLASEKYGKMGESCVKISDPGSGSAFCTDQDLEEKFMQIRIETVS
jgi:hypothetical protein